MYRSSFLLPPASKSCITHLLHYRPLSSHSYWPYLHRYPAALPGPSAAGHSLRVTLTLRVEVDSVTEFIGADWRGFGGRTAQGRREDCEVRNLTGKSFIVSREHCRRLLSKNNQNSLFSVPTFWVIMRISQSKFSRNSSRNSSPPSALCNSD